MILTTGVKGGNMRITKTKSGNRSRQFSRFFIPVVWGSRTPNILNKCQRLLAFVESPAYSYLSEITKTKRVNMTKNIMPIVKAINGQATTLTVVKQHSRKLPTVRVKKEITLPQKQMGALGEMIKNCVHAEMEQYLRAIKEPSFDFGGAYNTAKGNAERAVNTYNKREFMDASDAIRKFGYACYNMGTLDAVANLMKQGKITER